VRSCCIVIFMPIFIPLLAKFYMFPQIGLWLPQLLYK
jgi:hypothetical protein